MIFIILSLIFSLLSVLLTIYVLIDRMQPFLEIQEIIDRTGGVSSFNRAHNLAIAKAENYSGENTMESYEQMKDLNEKFVSYYQDCNKVER